MLSWFVTRHALFIIVIISAWRDSVRHIPPIWDPKRGYFLTSQIHMVFIGLLILLEVRCFTLTPYHDRIFD